MGVRARGLATGGLALLAVAGLIVAARRARLEPLLVRRAGLEMVKRVVGLRGEHVRLLNGRLEVDGRQVAAPYAAVRPALHGGVELDVRLGGDELAVLGDSRGHSTDSRSFGAVPSEDVIGIVRFAYWPPRRVRG